MLRLLEAAHDCIVLHLLLGELFQLLARLLEGLHNLLVGFLLVHLLLLLSRVFFLRVAQLILQLLDNVQIGIRYFLVIVLYVCILARMLGSQVLDGLVLL